MRRLVARLPVWVQAYPVDLLLIVLCLQSGLVSLFGWGPARPLEAAMPWWAPRMWAVCLLAGSACWLAGLSGIRGRDGQLVARRLPVLMLGLRLLALVMPIYFAAVVLVGGLAALLSGWILLFAAAMVYIRLVGLDGGRS
jgi:hypothetical protein